MPDYALHDLKIGDDARPELDGSVTRFTKAVFYLGKHGPFTERFPKDQPFDGALRARIDELTRQLRAVEG